VIATMTTAQFDTLVWLVVHYAATGTVPTQEQAAAHFGVQKSTIAWRWSQFIARGYIATKIGQSTTVLDAGRLIVAAGKQAATGRRVAIPNGEPLPPSIPLAARSFELLRAIYANAQEGLAHTVGELAAAIGRNFRAIASLVRTLRMHRLLAPGTRGHAFDGIQLTALGVGVADGRVAVVSPWRGGPGRPKMIGSKAPSLQLTLPLSAPKPPPAAPKPAPPAKPAPRVAPIQRELAAAPLPPPALPVLSPTIATLRGIRHPPPPQAHAAPPGMRETTWTAITTVRSPMAAGWS